MTSEVVRSHVEATYLTVETVSVYGVKAAPSSVTVNSQEASFSYLSNQVRVLNTCNGEGARRPVTRNDLFGLFSVFLGVESRRVGSEPQPELHHQLEVIRETEARA